MDSNKVVPFPADKRRQSDDTARQEKSWLLEKLADFNGALKDTLSRLIETEKVIRGGDIDQMHAVRDQLLRQLTRSTKSANNPVDKKKGG